MILVAILPAGLFEHALNLLEAPTIVNYALKAMISGAILVLVLGFYLRMLFECGFGRDIPQRGAWLALLVMLPLVSAHIYFWVTRSSRYRNRTIPSSG
jgi:hypothetical protein